MQLEDVSFRYLPDRPLIEGLSLDVKPGQRIAIVGPTGCGKTSCIKQLAARLNYPVFEVTGHDILLPYRGKVYDCTGRLQNPSGLNSGVYIVIIGSECSKVIIR